MGQTEASSMCKAPILNTFWRAAGLTASSEFCNTFCLSSYNGLIWTRVDPAVSVPRIARMFMLEQTVCQYWGWNPGGGENFSTRSDRPWTAPSLLYEWDRVIYPAVQPPRHGVNYPPPSRSSVEVKEKVDLYTATTPPGLHALFEV